MIPFGRTAFPKSIFRFVTNCVKTNPQTAQNKTNIDSASTCVLESSFSPLPCRFHVPTSGAIWVRDAAGATHCSLFIPFTLLLGIFLFFVCVSFAFFFFFLKRKMRTKSRCNFPADHQLFNRNNNNRKPNQTESTVRIRTRSDAAGTYATARPQPPLPSGFSPPRDGGSSQLIHVRYCRKRDRKKPSYLPHS